MAQSYPNNGSDGPSRLYSKGLSKGEFRLILLYAGSLNAHLECHLVVRELENAPKYQALSYAWGSHLCAQRSILVNDVEMDITINLDTALRHLRREDTDVILWVDALCINQNDLSEREAQVQVMRNIYTLAERVTVFLGDGRLHLPYESHRSTRMCELIFFGDERDRQHTDRFISNYKSKSAKKLPTGFGAFSLIAMFACNQRHIHLDILLTEDKVLRSLFEDLRIMLLSKWWTRMWVFQEIVVSRNAFLRYGESTTSWALFASAAQTIERTLHSNELPSDCAKVLELFSRIVSDIEDQRRRWAALKSPEYKNSGEELLALLQITHRRKASDDRDKVYALLGLLSDELDIQPNYYMNPSDVYIKVACSIMQATGSFDVLVGDLGRKNRGDLPSWVPDWSAIIDDEEVRRSKTSTRLYNASGGSVATFWTSALSFWADILRQEFSNKSIPSALYTLAVRIGTVTLISDQFQDLADESGLPSLLARWHRFTDNSLDLESNNDILRALVFDIKFVSGQFERLDENDDIHLRYWYKAKMSTTSQNYQDKLGLDYVLEFMSRRRRLFVDKTGLFGWGPDNIWHDDEIYIFPGGKTPFILRKQGLHHQIIGSCYLQGAMDGGKAKACFSIPWWLSELPSAQNWLLWTLRAAITTHQMLGDYWKTLLDPPIFDLQIDILLRDMENWTHETVLRHII